MCFFPSKLFFFLLCPVTLFAGETEPLTFNRDIRPVLASKCFACHGPDESHREADLRLDQRESAINFGALVPGSPEESELLRRILSDNPDERMPPPEAGAPLSKQQKRRFRDWIQDGANYQQHWAFVPPEKHPLPDLVNTSWPRNEIDYFVLAQLEAAGLQPAAEADSYALIRRVYLDLVGLPPTPDQADAFVNDDDPQAYEELVDRLLNSERFGERWATPWLDLARYADTNGYEKDRTRSIWPYRDWVIRALNADIPFDQFTIEQLAGDMLPEATDDQRIATGFHRNTMLNEEGGIDPLEFRYYAMVDRVATTGTTWLGLSVGCAQCHTHKYDPITHTDYFRFMALMNNADESEMVVKQSEIEARRDEIQKQIDALEAQLVKEMSAPSDPSKEERDGKDFAKLFQQWLASSRDQAHQWKTIVPVSWDTNLPRLELMADGSLFSSGDITKRDVFNLQFDIEESMLPITAIRLEALPDERLPAGGPGRTYYEGRKGHFFLSDFSALLHENPLVLQPPSREAQQANEAEKNAAKLVDRESSTGWGAGNLIGKSQQVVLNLATPLTEPGELQIRMVFESHFAASLGRFRLSTASADEYIAASELPPHIENLLARSEALDEEANDQLRRYFLVSSAELAESRKEIDALRAKIPKFPTSLIMEERPDDNVRKTFRHHRGEFLSPRNELQPGVPHFLNTGTTPSDRLELARWLVSEANPLVGRVTVNRVWQNLFGAGLHRSSDDFGTQAAPPTHPKLLDWLACEFVEQGWSLKKLLRKIVTSATYQQSSQITQTAYASDPHNRQLARGPRYRVEAEMVRDIMLQASGLLSTEMYGPGVKPPQPASVTAVAYGSPKWDTSDGGNRYRRSIYTFKKRTAPFAAYAVFDAPSGEKCIARRNRSNTPLQALTLLNDQMYLELCLGLAKFALAKNTTDEQTATIIFRRLLTRPPETAELAAIMKFRESQLQRLQSGELSAADIFGDKDATNKQASWAMVARGIMNLDEAITKP